MAEFFNMGGHGFYVWISYAVFFGVLTYVFLTPLLRHKRLVQEISRQQQSVRQSQTCK